MKCCFQCKENQVIHKNQCFKQFITTISNPKTLLLLLHNKTNNQHTWIEREPVGLTKAGERSP